MKKRFLSFCVMAFLFLLSAPPASSQTESIGIGTSTPSQSAILEISSTNKGVLIPRMSQNQRNAIPSPVHGLLIYQNDGTQGFYYYSSLGWQLLGAGGNGSGANRSLSNLEDATAINTHLLPSGSAVRSLGSSEYSWRDLYLTANAYFQGNRTVSVYGTNNFFGTLAGNPNINGGGNTGIGYSSLANNTGGNWNSALGYETMSISNGFGNTGIGYQSLYANSTGGFNTGTGGLSLAANAVGVWNTAHGFQAGGNLLNGNFNTFVGGMADVPLGSTLSNSSAIGYQTVVTASNTMRFGNSDVNSIGGYVNWTALSDGRFKQDVQENVPGLAFIKQLRPVTYQLALDDIDKTLQKKTAVDGKLKAMNIDPAAFLAKRKEARMQNTAIRYSGFIAQEVEAAAGRLGYRFSGVDAPKNGEDFYGLRYAEFVVPLVKAVQELTQQMEVTKQENETIKTTNLRAAEKIVKQERQLNVQQTEIDTLKQIVQNLQAQIDALKSKENKQP